MVHAGGGGRVHILPLHMPGSLDEFVEMWYRNCNAAAVSHLRMRATPCAKILDCIARRTVPARSRQRGGLGMGIFRLACVAVLAIACNFAAGAQELRIGIKPRWTATIRISRTRRTAMYSFMCTSLCCGRMSIRGRAVAGGIVEAGGCLDMGVQAAPRRGVADGSPFSAEDVSSRSSGRRRRRDTHVSAVCARRGLDGGKGSKTVVVANAHAVGIAAGEFGGVQYGCRRARRRMRRIAISMRAGVAGHRAVSVGAVHAGTGCVLERNPAYWGPPPAWSRVVFRFVPNDSARHGRVAAGDLDVIDTVPPSLYPRCAMRARHGC